MVEIYQVNSTGTLWRLIREPFEMHSIRKRVSALTAYANKTTRIVHCSRRFSKKINGLQNSSSAATDQGNRTENSGNLTASPYC